MDIDHKNVRAALDEDRLSALPHELINQILSRFDTKFVVQTCLLLSPRWKLIWTSMPCLNFSSREFKTLPKFAKLVKHVLSLRNHQVQVSSVNLTFSGAATQVFVRKIANYAFSHNIQQLTVDSCFKTHSEFPSCLFSSQTLKHLTFGTYNFAPCLTPKTPWDFPALTTLYLNDISLCDDERESLDLFSMCVNLQNLTLIYFTANAKVFEIITPRLSNLTIVDAKYLNIINVIAPQLENLTIKNCEMKELNIPLGTSSFCYQGYLTPWWFKDHFHSVNKASVSLNMYCPENLYKHEDARGIIKMLQELHSAKFLTLNLDIVECISSFPELLATQPSPFSNMIRLKVDCGTRDTCKVKMSSEARNFLLEKSPNATFIMKELPTEAMKEKEVREKIKAEIEDVMKELQASVEQDNILIERNQAIEKTKVVCKNLVVVIQVWTKKKMMQIESESGQIEEIVNRLGAQFLASMKEIMDMFNQEIHDLELLILKTNQVKCLLDRLPKRHRIQMEARFSLQLQQAVAHVEMLFARQASHMTSLENIVDAFSKDRSSMSEHVSSIKHPLPSQTSSS